MAGQDDMDATTISDTHDPKVEIKETYTFGVPKHFLADGVDEDVSKL